MVEIDMEGLGEGEGIGVGDNYELFRLWVEWQLVEGDNQSFSVEGTLPDIGSDILSLPLLFGQIST